MTGDPALLAVEAIGAEINRIVAERRQLREAAADTAELERDRRRLAGAQSQLQCS